MIRTLPDQILRSLMGNDMLRSLFMLFYIYWLDGNTNAASPLWLARYPGTPDQQQAISRSDLEIAVANHTCMKNRHD